MAEAEAEAAREALREDDACAIDLEKAGHSLFIEVRINGVELRMVLDAGASITTLTSDAADRAGLTIDPERRISVHTPNGTTRMDLGDLDTVELGGVRLDGGHAAVCTECTGFGDGLFGLDLRRRFDLDLDLERAKVHLPGCE